MKLTFLVAFAYLEHELHNNLIQALQTVFRKLFTSGILISKVTVTNQDFVMMNAIEQDETITSLIQP